MDELAEFYNQEPIFSKEEMEEISRHSKKRNRYEIIIEQNQKLIDLAETLQKRVTIEDEKMKRSLTLANELLIMLNQTIEQRKVTYNTMITMKDRISRLIEIIDRE